MSAYSSNLGQRGAIAFVVASAPPAALPTRIINLVGPNTPAKVFQSEDEARKWLAARPRFSVQSAARGTAALRSFRRSSAAVMRPSPTG